MNKVILIGYVGADPETKISGDTTIATFSLATVSYAKSEKVTDWHNVVCFGKTADYVSEYFKKGNRAAVDGEIRYESWTDRSGQKRIATKIIAWKVEGLMPKVEDSHPEVKKDPPKVEVTEEEIPF